MEAEDEEASGGADDVDDDSDDVPAAGVASAGTGCGSFMTVGGIAEGGLVDGDVDKGVLCSEPLEEPLVPTPSDEAELGSLVIILMT